MYRIYKRYHEGMRSYLCPLHHRGNYTSLGRHFTLPEIVTKIAERTVSLMQDGDWIVDMTCGRNTFVPQMKRLCAQRNIKVTLFERSFTFWDRFREGLTTF